MGIIFWHKPFWFEPCHVQYLLLPIITYYYLGNHLCLSFSTVHHINRVHIVNIYCLILCSVTRWLEALTMSMLPWGFIGSNPVGWSRQWLPHGNHKWLVGEYRSNKYKTRVLQHAYSFCFVNSYSLFLGVSWYFLEFLGISRNSQEHFYYYSLCSIITH